jgi:hypothetical protein
VGRKMAGMCSHVGFLRSARAIDLRSSVSLCKTPNNSKYYSLPSSVNGGPPLEKFVKFFFAVGEF